LVAGSLIDFGDKSELTAALVGSDALAVGTGIVASNSGWSRNRVRLANLAGVLGTIGGLGVDLIAQPDDVETWLAIAGTIRPNRCPRPIIEGSGLSTRRSSSGEIEGAAFFRAWDSK